MLTLLIIQEPFALSGKDYSLGERLKLKELLYENVISKDGFW